MIFLVIMNVYYTCNFWFSSTFPPFFALSVLRCFHPTVYTDIANGELQRGKLEMTCIQIYEAIICQFDASVDISAAEERVSLS